MTKTPHMNKMTAVSLGCCGKQNFGEPCTFFQIP